MRIEKDDRKLNVLSKLGLVHTRWLAQNPKDTGQNEGGNTGRNIQIE